METKDSENETAAASSLRPVKAKKSPFILTVFFFFLNSNSSSILIPKDEKCIKRVQPFSDGGWQCHAIKDVAIRAYVGTELKAWISYW